MRRLKAAWTLPLVLALPTCAGGARAPFTIPPAGQPSTLVADAALPPPTAMAFDSQNRPYFLNTRQPEAYGLIHTLREGHWVAQSCLPAIRDLEPDFAPPATRDLHAPGELVLDDVDALYALLGRYLLYSTDGGEHFQAYRLPAGRASLEMRVGPGPFSEPPALSLITQLRSTPGVRWGNLSTLSVLLPVKTADGLALGEPVPITDRCLIAGSGGHSGGTSFAVTRDGLTHLVWAEMPDSLKGGNPTFVGTVDRRVRRLIAQRHLVDAHPEAPDVHSRPTIAMDRKGALHVIAGAHGQPFFYLRSLAPGSITAGWTPPAPMAERQTYASLVCDDRDRLHSVFRQWRPEATLGYQSKPTAADPWSPASTLVFGALERGEYDYGIFYQRLAVDRRGGLYLAFTFWEEYTKGAGDYPEALALSTNGGEHWSLVETAALARRVAPAY